MGSTLSKLSGTRSAKERQRNTSASDDASSIESSTTAVPEENNEAFELCHLLAGERIPSAIWLEHLLACYGCETQVWDLNLLVKDPTEAARALSKFGYQQTSPDRDMEHVPLIHEGGIRVSRYNPPMEGSCVVLLAAADWHYDPGSLYTLEDFKPPLYQFIDSLVETWLNIPVSEYGNLLRFALHVGCLIYYCYRLTDANGQRVCTNEYAENLKSEHRELHYDIVSPHDKRTSFTTTDRHRYHVGKREEIKDGKFVPRPYRECSFRPRLAPLSE